MARETKAAKAARETVELEAAEALKRIVDATCSDPGYTFCSDEIAAILIAKGFIEQNDQLKNESGHLATRATKAGIDEVKSQTKEEVHVSEEKEETAVVEEFVIEDVALPPVKRNPNFVARASKYPFDKLEVGQTFFVPGKDIKTMASTVANANKKYAVPAEGTHVNRRGITVQNVSYTKKFAVRAVEGGVRIGRTV